MAELVAFGLAANIAQFVAIAAHVVKRINDFQSLANDAPKTFRDISHQLPLMINMCEALRETALNNKTSGLDECLKGCIEQLAIVDGLVSKILPNENDSKVTRTWKALGSVKLEGKVAESQRILETYKTTMTMYFSQETVLGGSLKLGASGQQKTCFLFPSSASSKFVGRKDILKDLEAALLSVEPEVHSPNVAVLLGLGGQGKTSIALQYCRQAQDMGHFMSILWIDATSLLTLEQSFETISADITKYDRTFPNSRACIQFVKRTIESWAQPWLMVFDNYDHIDQVRNIMQYIPKAAAGAVLITSRSEECEALGTPVRVLGMQEEESVRLLLQQTRLSLTPENRKLAKPVADLLGHLPLALDQSAAYIRSKRISLREFMAHYEKRKAIILQHTPALWDYHQVSGGNTAPVPNSVYTTWDLSFRQVGLKQTHDEQKSVQHFLSLLAFFNNIDIQMDMFAAYFQFYASTTQWLEIFAEDKCWEPLRYQDVVTDLSQLSLLQYRGSQSSIHTVSLHPLVRDWMQLRLSDNERRRFMEEAALILESYVKMGQKGSTYWSLQVTTETLCHINACLGNYGRYMRCKPLQRSSALREAIITLATFYIDRGRYTEAEDILKRVMQDDSEEFGRQSPQCAHTQLYLTDVYLHLSKYDEASQLLAETEKHLAECGPSRELHYLSSLARKAFKLGEYEEAAELYKSVISKQKSLLPSNDPQVLGAYASLAQVFRNQGNYDEAFKICTTTLSLYQKLYNHEHPETLETMVKLANCYRNQGLSNKADGLYQLAYAGNEKFLGPSHPTTLMTMIFYAVNHRNMLQLDKAEELFTKALGMLTESLGPDHDTTLKAITNLATNNFYQALLSEGKEQTRRAAQAEVYYRHALKGREASLGFNSHYTMRTVERLLDLLWRQQRYSEAQMIANYVLQRQRRRSSSTRPSLSETASDRSIRSDGSSGLANISQYKYHEVESIFEAACEREEQVVSAEHPDRIEAVNSLALVYLTQERMSEAKRLMTQVVENSKSRFGATNKLTRDSQAILDQIVAIPEQESTPSSASHDVITVNTRRLADMHLYV